MPVLGTVLIPAGAAPAGGRPILAFNHGTTGSGADCAESVGLGGPNGYHEWPAPWIERDYVIVSLVETYAPELHLKAVVASAPPVRIDSYLALLGR
ncbi:hypothetical protein [Williamsia sp.]|uniref:hypothetical protein n=1 Tax=Williamsia sp. TaxID=1872085 RepID=UPI002F94A389